MKTIKKAGKAESSIVITIFLFRKLVVRNVHLPKTINVFNMITESVTCPAPIFEKSFKTLLPHTRSAVGFQYMYSSTVRNK